MIPSPRPHTASPCPSGLHLPGGLGPPLSNLHRGGLPTCGEPAEAGFVWFQLSLLSSAGRRHHFIDEETEPRKVKRRVQCHTGDV